MSTIGSDGWHRVAKASAVREGEPVSVDIADQNIALCRLGTSIYAIDNICSHEYACLSDGLVEDGEIECPLHQARFDIKSGKALTEPATVNLRTFEVKVEGDDVLVRVEADPASRSK